MKLYTIGTGSLKLDGGAMFGVVPKTIWQHTNPADADNRITLAMRSLLIETAGRLILVDTGLGTKYDEKFARLYDIDIRQTLHTSLQAVGFGLSDVTDVVLTHLHFDHCGGTTYINPNTGRAEVTFPNAQIWLQRTHWESANHPNAREKASFFADNLAPLEASGQLRLLEGATELYPGVELLVFNGHTAGQQLPLIQYKGYRILFAADLFPTFGHIPLPYVMGYDVEPLVTLQEREVMLSRIVGEELILFYQHDPTNECGRVARDDRGRFSSKETFRLSELG